MEQSPAEKTATAVRVEMARANVKPFQLAKSLGISRSTLSRRLAGAQPFNIHELTSIADFLGCPLTDLLPAPRAVA